MSKDEKCKCKACKSIDFHCQICKFVGFLLQSSSWLLKLPFCCCVADVSIWWQMINSVLLSLKRWFQFNSRIVKTYFSSIMTLNNWETIAETRGYILSLSSTSSLLKLPISLTTPESQLSTFEVSFALIQRNPKPNRNWELWHSYTKTVVTWSSMKQQNPTDLVSNVFHKFLYFVCPL